MDNLFKQALKLQEKLRTELQKIKVEGSAGGGMVRIEMDGEQNVISLKIEPQILEEKDINLLQDLIVAAFNDAQKKVKEKIQETIATLTGLPFV
ncbi:MAG: YbaB/EbfC family nucleoid-associated protein [candidate division WOR-3 bacterium]